MPRDKSRKPFSILVQGDIVVDQHIYLGHRDHPSAEGDGTRIIKVRGGAGQTADLLKVLCEGEPLLRISDTLPDISTELSLNPTLHQAYATWATFPVTKNDRRSAPVWRVNETFGFGKVETPDRSGTEKGSPAKKPPCDVIVIDEGGLGFRHQPERWSTILRKRSKGKLPWIILKMSHPVCRGDLWANLIQDHYRDRLIVIVTADDLRRSGASISQGLSWEQSVRELLGDLKFHPDFSMMAKARHIIINFGHDGALWVDNTNRRACKRHLIFDPGHLEGIWEENLEGSILGAGACLTASVARALFEKVENKSAGRSKQDNRPRELRMTDGVDLGAGIARGLAARRALLLAGHGTVGVSQPGFPYKPVLEALTGNRSGHMKTASVPEFAIPERPGTAGSTSPEWSIIMGNPVEGHRPLYGRARKVAIDGEAALSGIPFGRFGHLYTVDSIELKGFYGLRKLITDYKVEKHPENPLSLGVFGPPGSGKSFGIKQIARGILGDKVPILTFNLSQFTGPEMLIGALHQVRDEVLKGKLPVVFWDEFDSDQLSWLQFMLAPMNDGEFLEGQVTHPVGKCIFIFAGGASHNLESFCSHKTKAESQAFINAKGPDFISRLKGYLNVLGPNPRLIGNKVDPVDIGFPIRRAIMLRVLAGFFGSKHLAIDPGLLNAMLKIGEFKHGARSMETIIKLTTGVGKRELLRCNIPPREQLGLHVDYDEFMTLVHEGAMFKLKGEELAPAIHQFYLDQTKQTGGKFKYAMPYKQLPEEIKQENVAAACRLSDILALVGLVVVDGKHGPAASVKKVRNIIEENIEFLAEAEHNGWMEFKQINGWRFDEQRDDDNKRHPSLIPYDDLLEEDKEKDRNSIRNYQAIVKLARCLIRE